MKEIILYVCEVCGQRYQNRDQALECESTPVEELLVQEDDDILWYDEFYKRYEKVKVIEAKIRFHEARYRLDIDDIDYYIFGNKEFHKKCKI